MIHVTNLQKLEMLRNHLVEMDSASGDAELLTWALNKIHRAKKIGGILYRGYQGSAGKQYGKELMGFDI